MKKMKSENTVNQSKKQVSPNAFSKIGKIENSPKSYRRKVGRPPKRDPDYRPTGLKDHIEMVNKMPEKKYRHLVQEAKRSRTYVMVINSILFHSIIVILLSLQILSHDTVSKDFCFLIQ